MDCISLRRETVRGNSWASGPSVYNASGSTAADIWVGALLLVAAGLLFFAKSLDNGRRADRMLDGPDIAAAAATVAV